MLSITGQIFCNEYDWQFILKNQRHLPMASRWEFYLFTSGKEANNAIPYQPTKTFILRFSGF